MYRIALGAMSLVAGTVIVVSGCNGSASSPAQSQTTVSRATVTRPATVTNTVTVAPSPQKTTKPETSTSPTPQEVAPSTVARQPSDVVRDYFDAINAHDYRRAWDLGGRNLAGDYETFASGFAGTAYDTVEILGVDGGTVSITLDAVQNDGSLRHFEGSYSVRGGVITAAEVREVTEPTPGGGSPYYENCDAARAAGAAPVYSGEPGYGPHLDRDGDGVGCEP